MDQIKTGELIRKFRIDKGVTAKSFRIPTRKNMLSYMLAYHIRVLIKSAKY